MLSSCPSCSRSLRCSGAPVREAGATYARHAARPAYTACDVLLVLLVLLAQSVSSQNDVMRRELLPAGGSWLCPLSHRAAQLDTALRWLSLAA